MSEHMTIDEVREWLDYDPATGIFTWKKSPSNHVKAGMRAGRFNSNGYWDITLLGGRYLTHRLAWFYVYGTWPAGDLDHKNRQKDDNRIENLRPAPKRQNALNSTRPPNSTGYRGVDRPKGKSFRARVKHHNKVVYLGGRYATAEEAHAVVLAYVQKHDADFFDPALWVYK